MRCHNRSLGPWLEQTLSTILALTSLKRMLQSWRAEGNAPQNQSRMSSAYLQIAVQVESDEYLVLTSLGDLVFRLDVDRSVGGEILLIDVCWFLDIAVFCIDDVRTTVGEGMPFVVGIEHVPRSSTDFNFEATEAPGCLKRPFRSALLHK